MRRAVELRAISWEIGTSAVLRLAAPVECPAEEADEAEEIFAADLPEDQ